MKAPSLTMVANQKRYVLSGNDFLFPSGSDRFCLCLQDSYYDEEEDEDRVR